jgi:hypothetical protein
MITADALRQKQLGQYFTGTAVARLLAALADAKDSDTIVDPMVGSGDMLRSCFELGAKPSTAFGIDVDRDAVDLARATLGNRATIVCGDAFSANFPPGQFDLVITNPPYIRYQTSTTSRDIDIDLPSSTEIRQRLLEQIGVRSGLSIAAQRLFADTARKYPGTADVAVPAWILAAALVAEHGTLAVVVPQAWLSRQYAEPIRRMLDQAFTVDFIVEDGDASWFADAQVRTHLIVARRRPIDGSHTGRDRLVQARATRKLMRGGRLIGNLGSEGAVATALRVCLTAGKAVDIIGLTARREDRVGHRQTDSHVIASDITDLLAVTESVPLTTLGNYGWKVGQGMRTGANEFFYVDAVPDDPGMFRLADRWGSTVIAIPDLCVMPAVRRQSDLGNMIQVDTDTVTSRLITLQQWITQHDYKAALRSGVSSCWLNEHYNLLPTDVGVWITRVATSSLTPGVSSKQFPHLSAVATNVRTGRAGEPLSLWYHLPTLAPRHRPELFMARVCGSRPYACLSADSSLVVDANFATLWREARSGLHPQAMLSVLNSTWLWVNLERNCTVLGGGALKVEATDLRHIALPVFDSLTIQSLTRLGKRLVSRDADEVVDEIDWLIASTLVGNRKADRLSVALRALARGGLDNRSRKHEALTSATVAT